MRSLGTTVAREKTGEQRRYGNVGVHSESLPLQMLFTSTNEEWSPLSFLLVIKLYLCM